MKILISTGIYPPKIGGPAQYAKNLKDTLEKKGHSVVVCTYSVEDKMPTGIRHFFFFLKVLPKLLSSDLSFVLDTYSVGFPTVFAGKLFGKKTIIRTGGDFLWEQYVERTRKSVLFRDFYNKEINNFSLKEKVIFLVTRWTLNNASRVIFSTEWQRGVFLEAYKMDKVKTIIVENYYGSKEADVDSTSKTFVASTRNLKWKNLSVLKEVFSEVSAKRYEVELFTGDLPFGEFVNKIKCSYAVVLVSLGDISPNMILDAIRYNRPFICTKEVGIFDRIKDAGIFVDPLNKDEIASAVLQLLSKDNYEEAREKVRKFSFVHTWDEIADEFMNVYKNIK